TLLASGDWGGLIWLWDPATGRSLGRVDASSSVGQIWGLKFGPRGEFLAAAGEDGVAFWVPRRDENGMAWELGAAVPLPGGFGLAMHPTRPEFVVDDREGTLWVCHPGRDLTLRPLGVRCWAKPNNVHFGAGGKSLWFHNPEGRL